MAGKDIWIDRLRDDLGEPSTWRKPVEFPDSLALCALNSAYSLRGHSTAAIKVLDRYRALRPSADTDTGPELVAAMDASGGPVAFADVLGNHSKLPGTRRLRTEAIHEALTALAALPIPVVQAVQLRDEKLAEAARPAWLSAKGLGPLSWSYLLMNAGRGDQGKPDVKVRRYLTRLLNRSKVVEVDEAHELLATAAERLGADVRTVDRQVWAVETRRGSRRPARTS